MKVSTENFDFSLRNFFFNNKMENYEQMKISTENFDFSLRHFFL